MSEHPRVLITGVTGFIGQHVARLLATEKFHLTALVRPTTPVSRLGDLADKLQVVRLALDDINGLKEYLAAQQFDAIVHIGAVRGGRRANRAMYERVNVQATEQLAISARETGARFIFCSSVGVFGAIPLELPANDQSPRQHDSLYHSTKIRAEALVQRLALEGLDAVIVRPAITYGSGDDGFPQTLIRMVDRRRLFLPARPVLIHLTEVKLLARAFLRLLSDDIPSGRAYIVADPEPVSLPALTDAIHERLHDRPYPRSRVVSGHWFDMGASIARKLKKETWTARFQLISRHWFFDVEDTYADLRLPRIKTLAEFMNLVDEYRRKD
ncbi:MAG: NAD-dependent epimerase/dehydratase family protein [Candidatus Cloacimonetes bacterium]|nr:NAD-dependent epimerase/dehydratase family protein [Candidatus Cloacimonadota bacterium]